MNRLKLSLGAAAACAACCALPLVAPWVVAGVVPWVVHYAASAVVGTSIAALWQCRQELLAVAGVALLSLAALWAWRRRQSRRPASPGPSCGCEQTACSTERCRPRT